MVCAFKFDLLPEEASAPCKCRRRFGENNSLRRSKVINGMFCIVCSSIASRIEILARP
jgi:hypothetical protein